MTPCRDGRRWKTPSEWEYFSLTLHSPSDFVRDDLPSLFSHLPSRPTSHPTSAKERPTSILPPTTILPTSPYRPTYARRCFFGVGRNHFCSWQRLWHGGGVTRSDASSSLPFVCPRKGRSQSRSYCTTANSMRPITLQSIIR